MTVKDEAGPLIDVLDWVIFKGNLVVATKKGVAVVPITLALRDAILEANQRNDASQSICT